MAHTTLGGKAITTIGDLPQKDTLAPNFTLLTTDLSSRTLDDYKGVQKVLNIFVSVDTSTCATSTRVFNKHASQLPNTKILCISRDLPFAQKRFCESDRIDQLEMLSDFKDGKFGDDYGLTMITGAFAGLHARAVIVLDENHHILYTELVSEVANEPDYESALNVLKNR